MENQRRLVALSVMLFSVFTGRLWAEEAPPAPPAPVPSIFTIQIPLLKYSDTTSKETGLGVSSSERATRLATQPLGGGSAFISARIDKTILYVYPFSDFNKVASLGYFVRNDLLLGVDIGLNLFNNDQPKATASSKQLGNWVFYFAPIGGFTSETGLILAFADSTDRSTENGVTTTEKARDTFAKFTFSLTYAFTNNLRWNFGPYVYQDVYKVDGGSKTTAVQYGFVFANIRFKWS